MTEGESIMSLASLDMLMESATLHPGTSIIAEVKLKNKGKTALQFPKEAYTYSNEFEIAQQGDESPAETVSSAMALDSRTDDDRDRGRPKILTLQPNEESIDREDIAYYLDEPLKPGVWRFRALRKTNTSDILHSEWKHSRIVPWRFGANSLRFDPQGQRWQTALLNQEEDGTAKIWVRYTKGKNPASGTFKDFSKYVARNGGTKHELEKTSTIAFAHLSGSTSPEWMLLKEGESLRAIKSAGTAAQDFHAPIKGGPMELLESGMNLDDGERALFAALEPNPSGEPRIHFFKAGDGKVEAVGSSVFPRFHPGQLAHCWIEHSGSIRLSLAYAARTQHGNPTPSGMEYWTQDLDWDIKSHAIRVGKPVRQWADPHESISIQWDPSRESIESMPGLALLIPTADPRTLNLVYIPPGKSPQRVSVALAPGMKPEMASLCTRKDGQWAIVLVSGNGIFCQMPGSDSWTLLSQEKAPVRLLRAARVADGNIWSAWLTEGLGLKWSKAGLGK